MPNKNIVDYIEKELRNGFHVDEIRTALMSVGHRHEHVEEAVQHVKSKREKLLQLAKNLRFAIIILSIILVVLVIYYFVHG
jgi:ribosomal 50S subunit-associated protein YjgA (DUF615 family)